MEDWGQPENALHASEEALTSHGSSPELLAFVVPLLARLGRWREAEALLGGLELAGNPALFHESGDGLLSAAWGTREGPPERRGLGGRERRFPWPPGVDCCI